MVGGSHTIIMRAEIYVDALGRIERWAGKLSLRRISLRFDLRSSWASEEAEMVIFYRERVACAKAQGSSVFSFTYLFILQICIECQPCVCTMHRGYKVNNYEAYMESFTHLRLNYALVTT